MGRVCRFIAKDGTKSEFSPYDIVAYRFTDSKYFVSHDIEGQNYFLEYLINGKLSVYYLRNDAGDHYYVERETMPMTELPYTELKDFVENPESYNKKISRTIGVLTYFTEEAPQLKPKIRTIKEPTHQNLIRIAKEYHTTICKDEECIVYEKNLPLIKVQLEPAFGFTQFFKSEMNVSVKNWFTYGLQAHFWLPRTNENLYFKTGVFALNSGKETSSYLKFPLQIEYVYPKGIIRPAIAAGTVFYCAVNPNKNDDEYAILANYTAGVKIVPNKTKWSLSVNYEITTDSLGGFVFFLPSATPVNQFVSLGVNYSF
jgi:hypothetical protein